jgi:hypothetical protein
MGYKPVTDVIAYIHREMTTNAASQTVMKIRQALAYTLGDLLMRPQLVGDVAKAWLLWYNQVKTGGPWDHKKHIKTTYGEWTEDAPNRTLYMFDVWSNLHFGYVGLACGFSEQALKSGAGGAQLAAGTVPETYAGPNPGRAADVLSDLDDPKDQAAIQVGFDLWKAQKLAVSPAHVLDAVRAKAKVLQTRPA